MSLIRFQFGLSGRRKESKTMAILMAPFTSVGLSSSNGWMDRRVLHTHAHNRGGFFFFGWSIQEKEQVRPYSPSSYVFTTTNYYSSEQWRWIFNFQSIDCCMSVRIASCTSFVVVITLLCYIDETAVIHDHSYNVQDCFHCLSSHVLTKT